MPSPPEPPSIYGLEADRFARIVTEGETPWITPEDTLGNLAAIEKLRASDPTSGEGGA